MIQGILLAAGAARRFGAPKLLHAHWRGRPIVTYAAANLVAVLPRTLAVVAPDQVALCALLRRHGVEAVVNPDPGRGMASSIATAVAASSEADGWVIALGDMPWLQCASIAAVANALAAGAPMAAPRYRARRGHPVGFSASLRTRLLDLNGADGGRSLLSDAGALQLIDVDDPGVLLDVDRPADLTRAPGGPDPGQ